MPLQNLADATTGCYAFPVGALSVMDGSRRVMGFALLLGIASCRQHAPILDNLSCDGTACLTGYTCDPVSDLCVVQPVVGCSTSAQICPTTTQSGSVCALAGFQVPCNTSITDCSGGGCRTCQNDHTWSSCGALAASSAGASSGSGSSSGTGSTGGSKPGAILSVVSGSGQSFGQGARAMAIGQPIIGTVKDSSGTFTSGFAATVQP